MAKYYVRSGSLRLVLDARSARDAAVKAMQWSAARLAEIYGEPERDRIREAEAVDFQLDDEIHVSEVGFESGGGEVFDVLDLPAVRRAGRACPAESEDESCPFGTPDYNESERSCCCSDSNSTSVGRADMRIPPGVSV